jgi:hypothetical protein
LTIASVFSLSAQSFDVENLKDAFGKGKILKLTGGFSANTLLNNGNDNAGRDPFTYYLNGNINLNICNLLNLPFTFSLTNSGSSYNMPSMPNRLSINPKYKWITGHIGDVSMNFSPYTLNGHLFTGAGVELSPESGWEFAAMYGRLQKAVEYDTAAIANTPVFASYKRMGYGAKIGWKKEIIGFSFNVFSAKDEKESLSFSPDSLGITPMQNLATSVTLKVKPFNFIVLNIEYGLSMLTKDIRSPKDVKDGVLGLWPGARMSSEYFNAIRANLDYILPAGRIGVGYERVDPEYRTLGAYYFTNDLENITVNASQSLFNKKADVSLSIGYQHDDLRAEKANATSRVVGSLNVTATFSERLTANASYSNFQTYTNIRSNFEKINQINTLDKLDTLNFTQLSQSVNAGINWTMKKTEQQSHSLAVNASYQDAADKQGGIYRPGSISEIINASSAYNVSFLQTGLGLNMAINMNTSNVGNQNMLTWGPTVGASGKLLNKKIQLSGSLSYNSASLEGEKQSDVCLARLTASYNPYKTHNITFAYTYQWRSVVDRPANYSSIATLGYTYNF